jgi:outer membrane lipoprotein-sorting protein
VLAAPFLTLLLTLFSFPPPFPDSAKSLVSLFESRYRSAQTLQTKFLESYIDNGNVQRTEAGIAYFRRPGKMRFEYEAPERDLFLVDGKTAWFFVPADHTVMRVPAKESTDWRTPLALLAGEMKVSRVCSNVQLAATERPFNPNDVVLHCNLRGAESDRPERSAAKPNASSHSLPATTSSDSVFFEIDRQTGELHRVLVRQKGGIQIEFKFNAWRFNPPVQEVLFHFAAPPGVTIVNGELPSGDASVK